MELPAEFVTLLVADASLQSGIGRLERLLSDASVRVYRYIREGQEHQFFFANGVSSWSFGRWASDAAFLYYSWDRQREQRLLVACGGSYVDVAGLRVLASERPVCYGEVMSIGGQTELFTDDPEHVTLQASLDRLELEMSLPDNEPKGTGA